MTREGVNCCLTDESRFNFRARCFRQVSCGGSCLAKLNALASKLPTPYDAFARVPRLYNGWALFSIVCRDRFATEKSVDGAGRSEDVPGRSAASLFKQYFSGVFSAVGLESRNFRFLRDLWKIRSRTMCRRVCPALFLTTAIC